MVIFPVGEGLQEVPGTSNLLQQKYTCRSYRPTVLKFDLHGTWYCTTKINCRTKPSSAWSVSMMNDGLNVNVLQTIQS